MADKIAIFWKWFRDNNKDIYNLKNEKIEIQLMHLFWLNLHLKSYCSSLNFLLIVPNAKNAKVEFRIVSDYVESDVKLAFELTKAAPRFSKCEVTLGIANEIATKSIVSQTNEFCTFYDIELKSQKIEFYHPDSNKNINAALFLKEHSFFWIAKNVYDEVQIIAMEFLEKELENIDIVMEMRSKHHGAPLIQLYDYHLYIDHYNATLNRPNL